MELSTLGKNEAASAATELWKNGYKFDVAYSSRLKRAQQTLDMVLRISGQEDVPRNRCWRLNERMYGGLTGLNKVETAEKYGDEQVKIWRRSFDTPPPEVDLDSQWYPGNDDEYLHIPLADIPRAESLKDCIDRTLPYWESDITPALKRGKEGPDRGAWQLHSWHAQVPRCISDDEILNVEIPTGIPLVYHLDKDLKPIRPEDKDGPLSGFFLMQATELNDPQKSHSLAFKK